MKIKCKVCRKETEIDELQYTPGDKIVVECKRCGNELEAVIPLREDTPAEKPHVKVVDNDLKSVWYAATENSKTAAAPANPAKPQPETTLTPLPTPAASVNPPTPTSTPPNHYHSAPSNYNRNIPPQPAVVYQDNNSSSSNGKTIIFSLIAVFIIAGIVIWLLMRTSSGREENDMLPADSLVSVAAEVVEPVEIVEQAVEPDYNSEIYYGEQESGTDELEVGNENQTYDAKFFHSGHGYKTTPSGLKYVNVVEGTGVSPTSNSIVTVHYEGMLTDGTIFDSSYARGEAGTFPLQAVIKGWTEGLQLMKVGGTTIFYMPSHLAYGETGTPGGPIGPNADLIFTVQLLDVDN